MKKNILLMTAAAAAVAFASSAYATPTLYVWDSVGTTKTVVDEVAGDSANGIPGFVQFNGALDSVWTLTSDAGSTYPIKGSLTSPLMDLSFNHISSTAAGTISVAFFGDGFGPTSALASALASIGGTLPFGATLTYTTYVGKTSATTAPTFAGGTLNLSGFNVLTTGFTLTPSDASHLGVSGDQVGAGASGGSNPYAWLQVITITTTGAISSGANLSGDASLGISAPDGGTTMVLLGSSLTALGLLRRSFKSVKA